MDLEEKHSKYESIAQTMKIYNSERWHLTTSIHCLKLYYALSALDIKPVLPSAFIIALYITMGLLT